MVMGVVTNLFKSKAPPPPDLPALPAPPPELPDASVQAAATASRKRSAAARKQSDTILTSPLGVTNPGGTGTKSLLGGG